MKNIYPCLAMVVWFDSNFILQIKLKPVQETSLKGCWLNATEHCNAFMNAHKSSAKLCKVKTQKLVAANHRARKLMLVQSEERWPWLHHCTYPCVELFADIMLQNLAGFYFVESIFAHYSGTAPLSSISVVAQNIYLTELTCGSKVIYNLRISIILLTNQRPVYILSQVIAWGGCINAW